MVETERGRKKASIMFATGERWKLTRDDLRDENGILILPLISLKRVNIDRTPGTSAMVREVPYITVKKNIHEKTSNIQNLVDQKRKSNFPEKKVIPVEEYLTIPFPDFCTIYYEITIWAQYQTQMNEILEKIFYNYDYLDSFAMHTAYNNGVGEGYRFVGYRDGNVTPQTNVEEFSAEERVLKYVYNIKVPVYLMLDPKDETLAYGRNKTETTKDKNTKMVYKSQNVVAIKLKESLVGAGVIDKLKAAEINLFDNQQDQARIDLYNLLSSGGSGGGGGGALSISTAIPPNIAVVGDGGNSSQAASANHTHGHGFLAGGGMHAIATILSAGFMPAATGSELDVLSIIGGVPKWSIQSSAVSTQVTGSDNFFVKQILQVSGSIVNPIGHLILSSSAGSRITVSGSLLVTDLSTITTRGPIVNDIGHLILSSSTSFITVSGALKVTGDFVSNALDSRYVLTSSYNNFTQSLNGFTASFSASVQSIGDARYARTVNGLLGTITVTAGPNITINTSGQDISITGSAGNVTGSTDFFVTNLLKVSGTITNPVGHLILSSTGGSIIAVSGNLKSTRSHY